MDAADDFKIIQTKNTVCFRNPYVTRAFEIFFRKLTRKPKWEVGHPEV